MRINIFDVGHGQCAVVTAPNPRQHCPVIGCTCVANETNCHQGAKPEAMFLQCYGYERAAL